MAASADPTGRNLLSFEVGGPWAHFRRIEGNIVKQTYRIIPRTTVAGLVAAMLGLERDSYYGAFQPGESLVAIELTSSPRTLNLPQNNLSTNPEAIDRVRGGRSGSIGLVDPTERRQQFNYEVLVEPSYRIDLRLSDDSLQDQLREALEAGRSHYVPSLGLSEHLATVDYLGEHTLTPGPDDGVAEVDSVVVDDVDNVVPSPDHDLRMERSPGYMEALEPGDGGGRRVTGHITLGYEASGGPLRVQDSSTYTVDDRTVMLT